MSDALVVNETDVDPVTWSDPVRGDVGFRTLFGGPTTRTDFTAGVTSLEAGGWLGHHRHEPSEIYYVLGGTGLLTIDGAEHVVGAGTAAFVPGNSEHGIHNTGSGPLRFFYAFAVGSFEEIEYDFTASRTTHWVPSPNSIRETQRE
jgi:mannose-6-phosphate isomerase-like protein (cupin superfamily)